jgi:hypothetical protein
MRCRAGGKQDLEFNMQNVDSVLDTVRPYLIADGGNCKVVDVDQACPYSLLWDYSICVLRDYSMCPQMCPHTPAAIYVSSYTCSWC